MSEQSPLLKDQVRTASKHARLSCFSHQFLSPDLAYVCSYGPTPCLPSYGPSATASSSVNDHSCRLTATSEELKISSTVGMVLRFACLYFKVQAHRRINVHHMPLLRMTTPTSFWASVILAGPLINLITSHMTTRLGKPDWLLDKAPLIWHWRECDPTLDQE